MLNKIIIHGRLTRDPELRTTQSGTPVASFTVAVDRDYSDQSGDRQADFIDCVAWKAGAEFVSKYFRKGQLILVEGRLQSRKWTDKDGNKRTAWEINADRTYFGSAKQDGGESDRQPSDYSSPPPSRQQAPAPQASTQQKFEELDDSDGELPF